MKYIVGTRGSELALAQTEYVIDLLREAYPEDEFEKKIIVTTGDRVTDRPLDSIGSRGVFTDAIEEALRSGEIQMAVHSMKDMPSALSPEFAFAGSLKRQDPRDCLILRKDTDDGKTRPGGNPEGGKELRSPEAPAAELLPKGAVVGTGSRRRAYQLKKLRPDVEVVPIRGNIDTRIRKLHEPMADGRYMDGIILAAAGVKRLHREAEIAGYFAPDEIIPAPAQGTLAIETRADAAELLAKINGLSDADTERETYLERGFLAAVGGDCHLPVGALAERTESGMRLRALFGNEDGSFLATALVERQGDGGREQLEDMISLAAAQISRAAEIRERPV